MTSISKLCGALAGWLALSLIATQAAVVNVDFNGNDHSPTTYTGQGALATADAHYWNPVNVPAPGDNTVVASSLLASDGSTPSPISVTLYDVNEFNYNYVGSPYLTTGNALIDDIYYNAFFASGTPSTFQVDGLTPGHVYNLFLYGDASYYPNTAAYFQIGASQQFVTGRSSGANATGSPNFWTLGTDYALFQVTANGSGQITGSFSAAANTGAPFSGLQIEEVLIPEPSTIFLLGLGSAWLWRRRIMKGEIKKREIIVKNIHTMLVLALIMGVTSAHAAVAITAVGLDTTTTNDWRTTTTAKPFDGDGDNVYGTLGYYLFAPSAIGSAFGNSAVGSVFSGVDQKGGVLSTNVGSSLALSDTGNLSIHYHASYGGWAPIDDPTPAADEASGYGYVNAPSANTLYDLLTITVGANMPAKFRLGLLRSDARPEDYSFVLYSGASTGTIALGVNPSASVQYAFFDVTGVSQGDTLTLALSTTGSIANMGLSGITVDEILIPEPSTLVLFSVGGMLLWRRTRKG